MFFLRTTGLPELFRDGRSIPRCGIFTLNRLGPLCSIGTWANYQSYVSNSNVERLIAIGKTSQLCSIATSFLHGATYQRSRDFCNKMPCHVCCNQGKKNWRWANTSRYIDGVVIEFRWFFDPRLPLSDCLFHNFRSKHRGYTVVGKNNHEPFRFFSARLIDCFLSPRIFPPDVMEFLHDVLSGFDERDIRVHAIKMARYFISPSSILCGVSEPIVFPYASFDAVASRKLLSV